MTTLPCDDEDGQAAAVVVTTPSDGRVLYLCADHFTGFCLDYVKGRAEEAGIPFSDLVAALNPTTTEPLPMDTLAATEDGGAALPAPRKTGRRANHQPAAAEPDTGTVPAVGDAGVLPSAHDH